MGKKERILEAIMKLIAKNGLHDTPMSQIASLANVATGTIYHHFNSKQDIVNELYKVKRNEIGSILTNELDVTLSYHDQVSKLWMTLYVFYRKNPVTFLFLDQVNKSSELSTEAKQDISSSLTAILAFIKKGQDENVFQNMNPWMILDFLHSIISTTVGSLLYHNIDLSQEDLDQGIEASWRLIKKDNSNELD